MDIFYPRTSSKGEKGGVLFPHRSWTLGWPGMVQIQSLNPPNTYSVVE